MSFKPSELERMPKQFERYMEDLGLHILNEIVDRIKAGNGITRTTDYLIYKYDQVKGFDEETKKYIQQVTKMSMQELDNLFDNVIAEGYTRDKELYTATGSKFVEYKDNAQLQQYIEIVKRHTKDELRNITNTTGYMINLNGKKVYTPTSQVFHDSLDKAVNQVMQGTTSYNEAIKAVCKELTESDLRTVDYSTGRSYNLPAAARMCVMTAVTQVTGKITELNMESLNTQFVETSWHATARPSHQLWQGRVFYWNKTDPLAEIDVDGIHYKSFIQETGYGSIQGLCGINCYHSYFPFIPGISKRNYTDEQLEQMQAEENTKKRFGSKEYTKYEATQAMRKMENNMRKQRKYIKALEQGNALEDDIVNAKARYRATMQQYKRFAETMELPQERARIYADGLRRVV